MMIPLGMAMMAGFVGFVIWRMHFRNHYQIAIFCIVPLVGILINFIFIRRSLGKLQALPVTMRPAAPFGASAANATGRSESVKLEGDFSSEPDERAMALMRAARPRQVRMSSWGKFGVAAGTLFALGMAAAFLAQTHTVWARTHSIARFHTGDWVTGLVGVLLLLVPYGLWRGQAKECELLENGEVALGKVTRQWTDKNGSSIECEFTDSAGQSHRMLASDTTRKLYAGMSVPVFYDRDNPKRNVAYCATLHEVVV